MCQTQPGAFNLLRLKCRHRLEPGNAAVGSRDHLGLPVTLSFHGFFICFLQGETDPAAIISSGAY